MRGRRDGRGLVAAPEGLRDLAGVRGDAPSNISDQAPLVWRAPEGPEGLVAAPEGLRDLAGVRGDAPSNISDPAPLVWRAPEGPEGTGGLRGAAPNEVRP